MSRVTLVTETNFAWTVTVHRADLPPSSVVAVIKAVPTATAVTFPWSSMVATEGLSDFQATVLTDAFDGETIAVNLLVSPSVKVSEDGVSVTDSTATYLPFFPDWRTTILAEPEPALIVITPSRS